MIEVLTQRGYERTRFQDVAAASGLAISTLQGYFGSRVDMLVEALRRSTDGEVSTMQALAAEHDDPWQRLVVLVDRGLRTPVPVWRMLMEFWCAAAHDEELREHSVDLQRRYRQPFTDAIEQGIDRGRFTPAHDPESIVDATVATLDGLLFPRVLAQPRPDHDGVRAVLLGQLSGTLGVRS